MPGEEDQPTPRLIASARSGDARAANSLLEAVHGELRALAARYLRHERPGHTLQPTALVNEACLRLLGDAVVDDASKTHLFAVAATTMRHVLVDHARRRAAARRGGGADRVTLGEAMAGALAPGLDVLAIDDALHRLQELDRRQARIVELRFFGGLTDDEIAAELDVSRRTVQGDWSMARAWLRRELQGGEIR